VRLPYEPQSLTFKNFCIVPCLVCGPQTKQRLFPCTAITTITETECVYCAVRTEFLNIIKFIPVLQGGKLVRVGKD